ncbi:MAG: hypothetical protein OXP71_10695 [Candidatus Poribacteria bacterium]|nr:hypothetical protein [Candidatus Poribacteria bacterium]
MNGEVFLKWSFSAKGRDNNTHRKAFKRLLHEGKRAWILVDALADRTRFHLNFVDHTFSQADGAEAIQTLLRQLLSPSQGFNRTYLLAQEGAEVPCYDITEHIGRCLSGDYAVADRLKGRTIFHLRQTGAQTEDLLSVDGVRAHAHRILQPYVREFAEYLDRAVIGFCCNLPTFLTPLRSEPQSIPWSVELVNQLETDASVEFLRLLPLIFHETYDSAAIRCRYWEHLTRQFAEICIGGLKKYCRELNLQFAINIPASARALEADIGELLNCADRPIFSPKKTDQPYRFLISKWAASVPNIERSGQISICAPDTTSSFGSDRLAYGSALGFNSWILPENSSTAPEDTLVNLNRFLSVGVATRPMLMISPIHSLWTKPDGKVWDWIKKEWNWLCQTVWALGYDFDVVSETELTAATVNKGAIHFDKTAYPLILLPTCLSLQEQTVNLLTQFENARGKLIALPPVPYLLNGRIGVDPYPLERLLYRWRTSIVTGETMNEKTESLKRLLRKWVNPAIQVYRRPDNIPTDCLAIHHRHSDDVELFYLYNREEMPVEVLVEMNWEAATLNEWNAATGEQGGLDCWHADAKTYTTLSFAPQQGRLIVDQRVMREA